MNEQLIVLKQLPVIEEHLQTLSAQVDQRVDAALSMVVDETTYKSVKATRAELNKEFQELEERRKAVKSSIMEPYDKFNSVYEQFAATKYRRADAVLKERISAVEDGLKAQKAEKLRNYYGECCVALNIPGIPFEQVGLNITMSASEKSLRDEIDRFLQGVSDGLQMIQNREDRDEVLVEFWRSLSASQAVNTVEERHRRMAEEKARADARAEEQKKEQERVRQVEEKTRTAVQAAEPAAPAPASEKEQVLCVQFKVTGTLAQLKALKKFLIDGGYHYE